MNVGELIKYYRQKKSMTQDELARALDMSKAYISVVENNTKHISYRQLKKFALKLGIPDNEIDEVQRMRIMGSGKQKNNFEELVRARENLDRFLMEHGYGASSQSVLMIPVVGRIPAGTPLVTHDDIVKNSKESIPVPVKEVRNAQCYFLEVVGDSMIDFGINDGDFVLIDPEDHEVGGVGRVMAVETKDGITLKTVVRVNEHTLRLISENARYAPTEVDLTKETVRIVGCVLPFMARRNPKLMS